MYRYNELLVFDNMQQVLDNPSSTIWEKIAAWREYHLPRIQIYIWFSLWLLVGVLFGVLEMHWTLVDSIYFSVSVMTTVSEYTFHFFCLLIDLLYWMSLTALDGQGGAVNLETDERSCWHYTFVSVYIIIGIPLMALCMSILANTITSIGGAQMVQDTLGANITGPELEMMQSIGIVDGDGYVDCKEYTILILVRMGVLLPDMIKNLNTVFVNMDSGAVQRMTSADLAAIQTSTVPGEKYLDSLRADLARVTKMKKKSAQRTTLAPNCPS